MNKLSKKFVIHIYGDYSRELLQGQLTCNIDTIKPHNWSVFAYCNHLGKVITTGYVHCHNINSWSLIIDFAIKDIVLKKLTPIAQLSDVDINNNYIAIISTTKVNPSSVRLPNSNYFLSLTSQQDIFTNEKIENEFETLELLAKIPKISIENTGMFTPNSLNLHNLKIQNTAGLSFNKGCYTGQEIVSKIYHKGIVKKHFVIATTTMQKKIQPMQTIYNKSSAIGFIIQKLTHTNLIGCIISNNTKEDLHWQLEKTFIPIVVKN